MFVGLKMSNNPLSTPSENDEIAEWQCPYCDQTRQSLPEIRDHITESTDGEHSGVDGLKPTEDIVAYGIDGEAVKRVEGASTEPADPIDSYSKQEIIINSWLAADRDPDRTAVEMISGATQQYVSKLLNDLDSGEIPRNTYIEILDYGLKNKLEERLEQYETEENTSGDYLMSGQTTVAMEDIIEDSTKKDRIIAAYHVSSSADKQAIADALGVSYEYVRQIFNDIGNAPEEWQKLREGDLEEDPEPKLRDAIEQRLLEEGALAGVSTGNESRDGVPSDRVSPDQSEGVVATEDIADVLEKVELLREQAEYTADGDAEFVAKKTIEWLDELIEQAE